MHLSLLPDLYIRFHHFMLRPFSHQEATRRKLEEEEEAPQRLLGREVEGGEGGRERERERYMTSSVQFQRINPAHQPSSAAAAAAAGLGCHKQSQPAVLSGPVSPGAVPDYAAPYHRHQVGPNQCCSAVVRSIDAPVPVVWSVVRRFDEPQAYKHFLKSCHVIDGDGHVGTVREVRVVSGLPANWSTERLEILDDERHVMSFSVVGGEHRLANYRSVTTLHAARGGAATTVVESYAVDVPSGNTNEETCVFADTIVNCNLQSLAQIAENMARNL